jgi:UDP-N-acetylglucosamine 2-epimerase (non-hydrolysing)
MLDQVLETFDIRPDIDLDLMSPNQALAALSAAILRAMNGVLENHKVDCMLVQGDTTTTMAGTLCAFYHRVKVGHVEAGLRTNDKYFPYPEEINRRITSHVADFHFAPTERSRQNLLREGIDPARVFVTGNTVIDALMMARDKIAAERARGRRFTWGDIDPETLGDRRVVTITGHRRENFGEAFRAVCRAIRRLAQSFPDVEFIYPVHLNPNVREPVFSILSGARNIHLIEPLEYLPFVTLMERCTLILSDSGGIQEEAPSLGKPVLVMREETERPEAVEAGTVILVGPNEQRLVDETTRLLTDPAAYAAMSRAKNPFGDGDAARRIVDLLEEHLAPNPEG